MDLSLLFPAGEYVTILVFKNPILIDQRLIKGRFNLFKCNNKSQIYSKCDKIINISLLRLFNIAQ